MSNKIFLRFFFFEILVFDNFIRFDLSYLSLDLNLNQKSNGLNVSINKLSSSISLSILCRSRVDIFIFDPILNWILFGFNSNKI